MKYRVCFAVAGFISFVSAGFAQAPLLPEQIFPELQPVLASALQQSPRMIERNLDLEAVAGDRMQARAGLYPQVRASFQESLTRDKREDVAEVLSTERLYYNVSVNQPIFYWGDVRNRAKIGDIREKIVLKQYRQGYTALSQEIRGTYLGMILQKTQLQATQYNQEQTELALKLKEDQLRKGAIPEADIFHPRIAMKQAVLTTERMRAALDETKRGFQLLTGAPLLSDDAIPATIPRINVVSGGTDSLLAAFLSQDEPKTVATEVAKQQLEIERINYAMTRTVLRPKFDLVAGISQDQQSYSTNLAAKYGLRSIFIGVGGNWSIFDGFGARGGTRASLARLRKNEANYKRLVENLSADARRAAQQLKFAERQMLIQEELLDSATNFLKDRQEQLARNAASPTDVAAVQGVYYRELLTTLQQRSDYLLKFAEFLALVKEDPALTNLPAKFR
ncbi:MAG: TolC family protein [Opitutaceae bacterium]